MLVGRVGSSLHVPSPEWDVTMIGPEHVNRLFEYVHVYAFIHSTLTIHLLSSGR